MTIYEPGDVFVMPDEDIVLSAVWVEPPSMGRGYIGFEFAPSQYDSYVKYLSVGDAEFSRYESKIFPRITNSRGAEVAAVTSHPINMLQGDFSNFGDGTSSDSTDKGRSSTLVVRDGIQWKGGVITESLFIGNPSYLSLKGDIYPAPSDLNDQREYKIVFQNDYGDIGYIATLQNILPNQWNHFDIPFNGELAADTYHIIFEETGFFADSFYLSDFTLSYLTFAWEISPDNATTFYPFYSATGSEFKGANFIQNPGKALKIRGKALVDQSWIKSYELVPIRGNTGVSGSTPGGGSTELPSGFWARFSAEDGDAYAAASYSSGSQPDPLWFQNSIWIPSGTLDGLDNASITTSAIFFGIWDIGGFDPPNYSSLIDQISLIKTGDQWNWYSNVAGDSGVEATSDTIHEIKYEYIDGPDTGELFIDGVSVFGGPYELPSTIDEGFFIGALNSPAISIRNEVYYFADPIIGTTEGNNDEFEDDFSGLAFSGDWQYTGGIATVIAAPDTGGGGNDHFTDAITISGTSGLTDSITIDDMTVEPGEIYNTYTTSGHQTIWFKWVCPLNGDYTFDTIPSDYDTVLAVYTGDDITNLVEVASDDDSGGSSTSSLTFSATLGTTYYIQLGAFGSGYTGNAVLEWTN